MKTRPSLFNIPVLGYFGTATTTYFFDRFAGSRNTQKPYAQRATLENSRLKPCAKGPKKKVYKCIYTLVWELFVYFLAWGREEGA